MFGNDDMSCLVFLDRFESTKISRVDSQKRKKTRFKHKILKWCFEDKISFTDLSIKSTNSPNHTRLSRLIIYLLPNFIENFKLFVLQDSSKIAKCFLEKH